MRRSLAEAFDTSPPKRVCLIKPSSLGDVAHALPVLSGLRSLWPDAQISWVINRGLAGLVDGHPDLDEVIRFDRGAVRLNRSGVVATARFLAGLRKRRFDLAIDLQGLFRSGVMAASTGARFRVGLAGAREGSRLFYTHVVESPGPEAHAVDRMMKVVEAVGGPHGPPRFRVAASEADRQWAREAVDGLPRPLVAINVGARWLTKRWPPRSFAEVARRASEAFGAGIVMVGAPEDRPLVDEVREHLGDAPAVDLCGRTTLPQLAALAAEVDVFVSNDTGPLHLAAAAGARTVGVYTCTSPARTGPYGPRSVAVTSKVWCAPSFCKTCDRLECLPELTPDRVFRAVDGQVRAALAANATRIGQGSPSPIR